MAQRRVFTFDPVLLVTSSGFQSMPESVQDPTRHALGRRVPFYQGRVWQRDGFYLPFPSNRGPHRTSGKPWIVRVYQEWHSEPFLIDP